MRGKDGGVGRGVNGRLGFAKIAFFKFTDSVLNVVVDSPFNRLLAHQPWTSKVNDCGNAGMEPEKISFEWRFCDIACNILNRANDNIRITTDIAKAPCVKLGMLEIVGNYRFDLIGRIYVVKIPWLRRVPHSGVRYFRASVAECQSIKCSHSLRYSRASSVWQTGFLGGHERRTIPPPSPRNRPPPPPATYRR